MGVAGKVTVLDTPLEARVAGISLVEKKGTFDMIMGVTVDFPPQRHYDISLKFPKSEIPLYLKLPLTSPEMRSCADEVYKSYQQGKELTIAIQAEEKRGGNNLSLPVPLKAAINIFLALTTFYRAEYKTAWGTLNVADRPAYNICFSYRESMQASNEVHALWKAEQNSSAPAFASCPIL